MCTGMIVVCLEGGEVKGGCWGGGKRKFNGDQLLGEAGDKRGTSCGRVWKDYDDVYVIVSR